MEILLPLLCLAFVIVAATLIHKAFPVLPLPLLQIWLGVLFAMLPIPLELEFEPEVFMVCLIAPILFGDARHASRKELWQFKKPILSLALFLVVFTVFGIGYVIHWLMPSIPLAAAFALAAVLSPTDAVAVQSLAHGRKLPKGLMSILEGESLLNDAAGLVTFKAALAVMLTGVFSFKYVTLNFIFVAIGGIVVGFILGLLVVNFRMFLRRKGLEDVNSIVTIQLMTPFVIFLLAEELHVSGILAVVVAGIIHGIERDRLQQTTTKLQIISTNTWSVFSYIMNGLVFVLLGLLLPKVIEGLNHSGESSIGYSLGIAALVFVALFIARFLWVFLFRRDFENPVLKQDKKGSETSRLAYSFAATVCGVHGTISLATALSIPLLLPSGEAFPMRDTILFISATVILLSMLAAVIAIPFLGNHEGVEHEVEDETMSLKDAEAYIANHTIQMLTSGINRENKRETMTVIRQLEEKLRLESGVEISGNAIREFQEIGRLAEQSKLSELIAAEKVPAELHDVFAMIAKPPHSAGLMARVKHFFLRMRLNKFYEMYQDIDPAELPEKFKRLPELLQQMKLVQKEMKRAAIEAIKDHSTNEHRLEALFVLQRYTRRIDELKEQEEEQYLQQLKLVQVRSIQIRRDAIQQLEETEQISSSTKVELLQLINYEEMLMLEG